MNRAVEPPFEVTIEVRDACLCLHAQRAARAIARRFDLALKPVGITSGQFSLLMSLNRPQPPQLGSVATQTDPGDRRARLLRLTPRGRALLARAVPIWQQTHAQIEAPLADPDRLREELNRLSRLTL